MEINWIWASETDGIDHRGIGSKEEGKNKPAAVPSVELLGGEEKKWDKHWGLRRK